MYKNGSWNQGSWSQSHLGRIDNHLGVSLGQLGRPHAHPAVHYHPITTKLSTYSNFRGKPTQNCLEIASVTIANSKGLKPER